MPEEEIILPISSFDKRIAPETPMPIQHLLNEELVERECVHCHSKFQAVKIFNTIVKPYCDDCDEIEHKRQAEELEKKRIEKLDSLWRMLCPIEYRADPDLTKLPDKYAVLSFQRVLGWKYNKRGFIAHGLTGRGKTRAVWAMLRQYHFLGYKIKYFESGAFGYEVSNSFSEMTGREFLQSLMGYDILFFDDFGQEVFTERVQEAALHIIEKRTSNGLPIIFTTNDAGETLETKFATRNQSGQIISNNRGPAIIRRIREFCENYSFHNPEAKKTK